MVLTWWVARQLLEGNVVNDASVDLEVETLVAKRIPYEQEKFAYQTMDSLTAISISPSIFSGEERGMCQRCLAFRNISLHHS